MKRVALVASPALLLIVGLSLAFTTPPEETQGDLARLLYVHVPSVITAYAALAIGLIAGVWFLIRRTPNADLLSASSIEIGVLFTALTLLTGMIWGRPTWGVWWDWGDARMMSTAILFFFYVSYLALRRSIHDPQVRAGRCAVLSVLAFVQVPVVHYSVNWFRTLHQGATIIRPDLANAPIDAVYGRALAVMTFAFGAVFVSMLSVRFSLARRQAALEQQNLQQSPAGQAITSPQIGAVNG